MADETLARRVPWIALALSFFSAGVGHIYCGRMSKGLVLYFAWILVPLGMIAAAVLPRSSWTLTMFILLPALTVVGIYVYAAFDAWQIASRDRSGIALRDYNRVSVYVLLIAIHMVYPMGLMAGVRGLVYEAFVIPTASMSPTIQRGDRILVRKLLARPYRPRRGELVVFRNPEPKGAEVFVKRVVAVAGDRVELRDDQVWINGEQLERSPVPTELRQHLGRQPAGNVWQEINDGGRYLVAYETDDERPAHAEAVATTVPEHHVYMLGDNRNLSKDSRHFGPIHLRDIIGNVDYNYWPAGTWSRFGMLQPPLP